MYDQRPALSPESGIGDLPGQHITLSYSVMDCLRQRKKLAGKNTAEELKTHDLPN